MRKIILLSVFAVCCLSVTVLAQTSDKETSTIEESLNAMQLKQAGMNEKLRQLSATLIKNERDIQFLVQRNEGLHQNIDSLKIVCEKLSKAQMEDREDTNKKIKSANESLASNQSTLENRTLLGCIIILAILSVLLVIFYYLKKRIKRGASSIDEVRKAQYVLQSAQTRMQEESIKLDNKLLDLFEKQIPFVSAVAEHTQTDHSLALKVADEIVRIELNLSRMDASVKGYKQLIKAIQRIKDNFNANGYELVDMLGKPYVTGMKAAVTFVTDENLEVGQQIITKIIKPQINYQQQMIQAAQIEVSQPE